MFQIVAHRKDKISIFGRDAPESEVNIYEIGVRLIQSKLSDSLLPIGC